MLGVLTDQAHNLILLSEDEARMLGQPVVDIHAAAIKALRRRSRPHELR
jgi:hypothetical protein